MRKSIGFLSLILAATLFASAQRPVAKPIAHSALRPAATREPSVPAASLPVTRVSLYKNGVGFFEHSGRVTGNQSVTIDFTTAQLNDVLQSLTAIDLDGGRIAGADYNSTTPLDQQLKALALGLGEKTTFSGLFTALRGARVSVTGSGLPFTGRIVDIEMHKTGPGKDAAGMTEGRFLIVADDSGQVRIFQVTPALAVRLLDTATGANLTQYLKLLESNRDQGLRHLTLEDDGTGTRDLHVSYLSEVPIWKSTYRILFTDPPSTPKTASGVQTATLQGWSVVDNTTGADWINVHLSLIAGAPQSFIQPLSTPYYSRRPEIPLPQEAQLTPQTHESGQPSLQVAIGSIQGRITDPSGGAVPNARITATNIDTGVQASRTTNSSGAFSMSPLQAGPYNVEVTAPGFQRLLQENVTVRSTSTANLNLRLRLGSESATVTVTDAPAMLDATAATLGGSIEGNLYSQLPLAMNGGPRGQAAGNSGIHAGTGQGNLNEDYIEGIPVDSFTVNPTTTTAFDNYFAYNLTEPITIRKNESALVPILQTNIDAERVTLWSPRQPTPLRALWITNTSNLTLDRGSFTIVEDGNFGGEGLLDPIHPAEKRLVSYAIDQAVRVTTESRLNSNRVTTVTAAKGILVLHQTQIAEITYVVHNAATDSRSVIVEHPITRGYTLDSDPKPEETIPTLYRFRVNAAPSETVRLHVGERRAGETSYHLTNFDDNQFTFILNQTGNNSAVKQALEPILDARRRQADMQDAVDKVNARLESLHSDEARQRENITALANADKSSRERFVRDLNATEDQIVATQKDLAAAQANLQTANDDLANKIESLQIDETI